MDAEKHTPSILMLPWLAHGHISPFLELAKRLSTRGFCIYFCSTHVNLCSLNKHLCNKAFPSIQLVELQLPSFPDLPPHCHTTKGLPPHLTPTLKRAFDMAKPSIASLINLHNPDLILHDFIPPWLPELASSQNIPSIRFSTISASVACFLQHSVKNPGVPFPFPAIYLHDHELPKLAPMIESCQENRKVMDRAVQSTNLVLMKTFREIEAKYIDYCPVLSDMMILPVGPLVQDPGDEDNQLPDISEWLSKRGESSVAFVCFGSEYFLSKEEMEEFAYGLELSEVSFIWVVKFPDGDQNMKKKVDEALPEGFLDRVGERGMVFEGWVPQATILGHASIGGFVSHCGWSSLMEAMQCGVPIIAVPMHIDQPLNARLVVEVGVGLEVKRKKDGKLERGEIAKVIKEIVVDKGGEEIRRKAKKVSEEMQRKEDTDMDVAADELLQFIMKNSRRNSNM